MDNSRGDPGLAAAQLESLQRITAAFATALTAQQVTRELVRHATESMDAEVRVALIDESGQSLDTAAAGYEPEVVTRHRRIPIDAPLPLAQVARTGQPLWFPDAGEAFARWPRFREVTADVASVALVPLDVGDRCLGALGLRFPQPRDLSTTDRNYLVTLGRLGGQALRRARQYDSEHTIAATLQRALLPDLPDLGTADVCARYHPASAGMEIGGDWYDVIALPEGRVGVVVGDVAGHNINAAAVMGQMRSALWAMARSEEDPGKVMTELNAMARDLPGMAMTTICYGVWDPTGELSYVSAGHLPPLISAPDGSVRPLHDTPPSVPLGVARNTTYTATSTEVRAGETLVAYTDGLIERRTESIDAGIARLTEVLESTPYEDLGDVCDDIRDRLHAPEQEDDTVLLALRLHANGQSPG